MGNKRNEETRVLRGGATYTGSAELCRRREHSHAPDGHRSACVPNHGIDVRFVLWNSGTFPVSDLDTTDRSNALERVSCGFPEHSPSCSLDTSLTHSQTPNVEF